MKITTLGLALGVSVSVMTSTAQSAVLINEVDSDNPSTDNAEFIELYDGGVGFTSLEGYSLVLFNGSSDTSYKSIDLSGFSTNAQGFFVVCGDASNVTQCDLDVSPDTNLVQNGADAVALYQAPADAFPNGTAVTTEALVDVLVYDTNDADDMGLLPLLLQDQPQVNEGGSGDKDNHSNQRCGALEARMTDGYLQAVPTPGAINSCGVVESGPDPLGQCGDVETQGFAYIHQVQGLVLDVQQDESPLRGQAVVIEGIVTTDLQGGTLANGDASYQYSGYWVQEEMADQDDNTQTSEGIFVYDYRSEVSVGDRVRLRGTVDEYNQVTQVKNISDLMVCAQQQPLPDVVAVQMPVSALTDWEALEGMRIQNQQGLIVSDLFGTGYGFGNYGQFVVSSQLHFQPTEVALPGSEQAQQLALTRPLDVLLIDDGVSRAYPEFIPFPDESGFAADNPMRIGYQVPVVSGVLHAYRNNYTLIPAEIVIDPVNVRTAAPVVAEDANLIIAGMNVLNYFNGDGQGNGFPTSRGAPTLEAFEMQSEKIVAALHAINADVIGLMEIENDGYDDTSAIAALTTRLNALQLDGDEYTFVVSPRPLGTDEIAVGLLYRDKKVHAIGRTQVLDSSNSPLDEAGIPLFADDKNRPALIQSFRFNGQEFTLAVNHFKSKGSACDEVDEGVDGQGNCNQTRTRAAQALMQFLQSKPTGIKSEDAMVLGDLNAYSQEDPMQVFYGADFVNLKYTQASTEVQPYSYSFSGWLGSLDHALATTAFSESVKSVDAWHINSVEAPMMDYLTEANGQTWDSVDHYAAADAYRSSDHDPIVVGLKLEKAGSVFWLLLTCVALLRRRRSL